MSPSEKREMPEPAQEDQWSKTWIRDELDDLGGPESFIWRRCIRDQIGLAMARCINDSDRDFYIDFSYGDSLSWSQMTRRNMFDLFKPIRLPESEESMEFLRLEAELSETIWDFYAEETEGFKYFKFQAAAVTTDELMEILDPGGIVE